MHTRMPQVIVTDETHEAWAMCGEVILYDSGRYWVDLEGKANPQAFKPEKLKLHEVWMVWELGWEILGIPIPPRGICTSWSVPGNSSE